MHVNLPQTTPHTPILPPSRSLEQLSSVKPVPGAKKAGDHGFIYFFSAVGTALHLSVQTSL